MVKEIPLKLHSIAESIQLGCEVRRIKRVNGWPEVSKRPYHLFYSDGSHLASYATLEKLEDAIRSRAGC